MCYSLCKDVGISENGEAYLTYGIKVFCKEGVKLIEDVSTDYYFVKSIVANLRSLNSILFTYMKRYRMLLQNFNLSIDRQSF